MTGLCVGAILGGGAFVVWLLILEFVNDYRRVTWGIKGRDW
jgi:hypothetical protein